MSDNNNFGNFSDEDLYSSDYKNPVSQNDDSVNVYTGNGEEQDSNINLNSFLEENNTPSKRSFGSKHSKRNITSGKFIKNPHFKRFLRIALTVLLIFIITCSIGIGTVVAWLASEESKGTFDMDNYNLEESLNFTTTIYVKNEKGKYVEYDRIHGTNNRIWVDGEQIPDMLKNAFISIEDKRFNKHSGVDWKRTVYAFANSFLNMTDRQGGSTITQQLVKNLTMDNDISAMRKVREIMRARYLEENYSKDSILEWYLNTIPMGTGIYGVEVAANYYFGKGVSDLTISECASLASITNEPEAYRPDLKDNKQSHLERRNMILGEMLSQDYITREQYDEAVASELKVVADEKALNVEKTATSYFVDTLIDDVVDMLVTKKNYDRDAAEEAVYNGGYKIYSTLVPKVQKGLEKIYKNKSYFSAPVSATNNKTTPNSSMTVMDYNGHVVGIVGGKGKKTTTRGLNRATSSPRQIGSSMKPLGVYSLAVEYNNITYSSFIDDRQMTWSDPSIKGGWPNNWDFSYRGKVSVEYAIYHSANCPAVGVLRNIIGNGADNYTEANNGIEISYDFLKSKLGMKHLTENDKNFSSLCLGGCSYGCTSEEVAAAYSIFGNGGYYYKPTTYTVIYDQFDNLVDDSSKDKPTMAISEDTATVMNHLLRQVVKKGTGVGCKVGDFDIFAKTGTTTDSQDLWFAGGTPYYVGACWYGFDNPKKYSPNGMGSGYLTNGSPVSAAAMRIWQDVMTYAHENLAPKEFTDSEYAEELRYCTSTGLLARSGCKSTAVGWYRADNIPELCTSHGGSAVAAGITSTSSKSEKTVDEDTFVDDEENASSETTSKKKKSSKKTKKKENALPTVSVESETTVSEKPKTESTVSSTVSQTVSESTSSDEKTESEKTQSQ